MARDYKREYRLQKESGESGSGHDSGNAKRHRARYQATKLGMVKPGDGKDLDHRKPISKGGTNSKSNWRIESEHDNRSFPRNHDGSMKANHPKT
jgi:hypothetical protein